ncbi:hypothetical protein XENORESO_002334 [Xenotaenia resolanae]|uniref:Uncharacterized protein n=1 Tax=Xenotaenia resolanae TaxID=208358 RepID=A0ABV0W828_9TELE
MKRVILHLRAQFHDSCRGFQGSTPVSGKTSLRKKLNTNGSQPSPAMTDPFCTNTRRKHGQLRTQTQGWKLVRPFIADGAALEGAEDFGYCTISIAPSNSLLGLSLFPIHVKLQSALKLSKRKPPLGSLHHPPASSTPSW